MEIKAPLNAKLPTGVGKTNSAGLGVSLPQALEAKVANTQASLSQLTAGQQLQATVLSVSGNQLTLQLLPSAINSNSTLLTLDIGQLLPNTAAPLKEGAQVQVQVQVIKAGTVPTFLLTPVSSGIEQKLLETIKQLLPIRTSALPLLIQLQQTLPQLQADVGIGEALKKLAQKILDNLPSDTDLTDPAQLKKAVSDSGLFLESKLAALLSGKTNVPLREDLKLNLAKLVLLLNQELSEQNTNRSADKLAALKDSLQKAQSALAGLTLDQLNSLPPDESPKQHWILELPFFNKHAADNIRLQIERDKAADQDKPQKKWAVSITINPPNLGTIYCCLSCYEGSVNTRFRSEAADTVELINYHLDHLKQQLENKGLNTGFMDVQQGQIAPANDLTPPLTQLISEKV